MSKIRNMTEKQPPSYPLRMPPELREQLTEAAKSNGRSMNAEIVARLDGSFKVPNVSGSNDISGRVLLLNALQHHHFALASQMTALQQRQLQLQLDASRTESPLDQESLKDELFKLHVEFANLQQELTETTDRAREIRQELYGTRLETGGYQLPWS